VNDQDLRILLGLLDTMDDHFDRPISGQEFLRLAASARSSLTTTAANNPGLAAAVHALDVVLQSAANGDPLVAEPYGNLRIALADLEELR